MVEEIINAGNIYETFYFDVIVLGDVEFRKGELYGCVELCEYFHNSTIELSKVVRRKYKLYNYVTPASYLELNRYGILLRNASDS